jgi:hypothetical protein
MNLSQAMHACYILLVVECKCSVCARKLYSVEQRAFEKYGLWELYHQNLRLLAPFYRLVFKMNIVMIHKSK